MEAWEALYRPMLNVFIDTHPRDVPTSMSMSTEASSTVSSASSSASSSTNLSTSTDDSTTTLFLSRVINILNATEGSTNFRQKINASIATLTNDTKGFFSEFERFTQRMASEDDTWRFWVQFVFVDAMAYISLYLSMRSGDWELRMNSIKNMAPLFTTFDHPI